MQTSSNRAASASWRYRPGGHLASPPSRLVQPPPPSSHGRTRAHRIQKGPWGAAAEAAARTAPARSAAEAAAAAIVHVIAAQSYGRCDADKPRPKAASPPSPPMLSHPTKSWWGNSAELEAKIPMLLQSGAATEARALLKELAEEDAPITLFYLGVATGQLEGEAAACGHYERALKQLPLLHAARNNLIRGLMRRGQPADLKQALEHAKLAAGLQPDLAEMQYQLGVVQMQQAVYSEAAAAFEAALRLEATHRGALINGIHCLQLLPPADRKGRERLEKMALMGVAAGLWRHPMQRPPHLVPSSPPSPGTSAPTFPGAHCSRANLRRSATRFRRCAPPSSSPSRPLEGGPRMTTRSSPLASGPSSRSMATAPSTRRIARAAR